VYSAKDLSDGFQSIRAECPGKSFNSKALEIRRKDRERLSESIETAETALEEMKARFCEAQDMTDCDRAWRVLLQQWRRLHSTTRDDVNESEVEEQPEPEEAEEAPQPRRKRARRDAVPPVRRQIAVPPVPAQNAVPVRK